MSHETSGRSRPAPRQPRSMPRWRPASTGRRPRAPARTSPVCSSGTMRRHQKAARRPSSPGGWREAASWRGFLRDGAPSQVRRQYGGEDQLRRDPHDVLADRHGVNERTVLVNRKDACVGDEQVRRLRVDKTRGGQRKKACEDRKTPSHDGMRRSVPGVDVEYACIPCHQSMAQG